MLNFVFVPTQKETNGFWRCDECGTLFHSGGRTQHKEDCSKLGQEFVEETGYSYLFGPHEVEKVESWGREHGEGTPTPLGPRRLTLRFLRINFPELL